MNGDTAWGHGGNRYAQWRGLELISTAAASAHPYPRHPSLPSHTCTSFPSPPSLPTGMEEIIFVLRHTRSGAILLTRFRSCQIALRPAHIKCARETPERLTKSGADSAR